MLLLWTERPRLLDREIPTHDWMIANRPWEQLGLELVHDNSPGDWRRYSEVFHATWERARREGTGFLNVESDVLPTIEAFRELIGCSEEICLVPYEILESPVTAERERGVGERRWGATIETRVSGGWDVHFARVGERWACDADLGFIRFSPSACQRILPADTRLTANDGLLNWTVLRQFRSKDPRDQRGRLHLHWPEGRGLVNNHRHWDAGDDAHHPPDRIAELHRIHAEFLEPKI